MKDFFMQTDNRSMATSSFEESKDDVYGEGIGTSKLSKS